MALPEYEKRFNEIEQLKKEIKDLQGVVLWANDNYTTREFPAQKINVELSQYVFIRIIYTDWGGSWTFLDGGKVPKNTMGILNPGVDTSRRYYSDDTGVNFEGPGNQGNNLAQIPIYIIGYKYW